MPELTDLTAHQALAALRQGDTSSRELTQACLKRIDRLEPALHAFLTRTRTGRNLYAIGGNPDAAALRGVPVRPVILLSYILCGVGAGLAGVLYASRFGNVNPASIGSGFELLVIAAAVIGGTSIFGGVGSATGAFLGCVLLGVINVALAVLQIADTWQTAVYGLVILSAVLFDDATARRLRLSATGEE